MGRAAIAFFDLDRTLIAINSVTSWLWEELRAGNVGPFDAVRALGWIARYSLGAADLESAILATIAAMKGRDEREIVARTAEWYARVVRREVRPGGRVALARHRDRGDKAVLLTSSSPYLSALVARDLDLDHVLCTTLEVDAAGLFTGRPVGLLCFGAGKLAAAQAYAAGVGIGLDACACYTDSTSDLPVLAAVGFPVAVNPDPRLARIARARGWPVVDWGRPARVRV